MTTNMKPGERLDDLQIKGYEIIQSPGRFCFGMDAVLLSSFAKVKKNEYALVFAGIVIAYFLQGIFNIDQTNTTTIFWIILACGEAMYRQYILKKGVE